jgi:hypothetical protein
MTDPASHPLQGRRRTPAFARYAALVAEALESAPVHGSGVARPSGDDGASPGLTRPAPSVGSAEDGPADGPERPDLGVLASAARSAARGLRPPCGARPAARPYVDRLAAAPVAPVADGAGRLDRRG